jgi:hypothetical protein
VSEPPFFSGPMLTIMVISEGATIWFINQLVKARVSRYTYGVEAAMFYSPKAHSERAEMVFIDAEE